MNPIKAEIGLREKWVLQRDLHIYLPYLIILPKAILGTTLQMYRDDNSMVFFGRHSEEKNHQFDAAKLQLYYNSNSWLVYSTFCQFNSKCFTKGFRNMQNR